jgi:hypothetical protein
MMTLHYLDYISLALALILLAIVVLVFVLRSQ